MEKLGMEDIRLLLAAFASFRPPAHPRLRLMRESLEATGMTRGPPSPGDLGEHLGHAEAGDDHQDSQARATDGLAEALGRGFQ
ncbi:MAG TPA: hypothetical protein VEU33_19950, partial [Archangium sp.]|nr:hypothetical protein [Archangium sp.]